MALSLKPFQGTLVTVVVAGAAVSPAVPLPDNCHTVLVQNPNAAAIVYVAFSPNAASFVLLDAVRIPAGAAITLAIGAQSERPATGILGFSDRLFFDASVNGSIIAVTYVNGISA
jgi:hypothetical protein